MITGVKMTFFRSFWQVIFLSFTLLFVLWGAGHFYNSYASLTTRAHQASPLGAFRQAQSDYEVQLTQTVLELLEQITGKGQVQVSVRADVDFEQIQKTQELLDSQNPVVVSTTGDDVSYAFSKQTVQTSNQGGRIKKLSVTILLDNQQKNYTVAEQNKIKSLVYSAVAFDVERGDTLEIITTPFVTIPFWQNKSVQSTFFGGMIILLTAVFGALWVKSSKLSENTEIAPALITPDFANPRVASALGASAQIDGTVEVNALKKAQNLMQKKPDETLTVLRGWICQGGENASG